MSLQLHSDVTVMSLRLHSDVTVMSVQLFQDVGDELLGVSQFVLPVLRDAGAVVRPAGAQQRSQRRPAVTVLP